MVCVEDKAVFTEMNTLMVGARGATDSHQSNNMDCQGSRLYRNEHTHGRGQQSDDEVAASASSPEVRKPNMPLWLRVETPNSSIWPMIK
jgi:hypothetical protein